MNKYQFLLTTANSLLARGTTMSVPDLATLLNTNGYTTSYYTAYSGGRGTYTLVHATYNYYYNQGMLTEAHNIAVAFTNSNGNYAY